MKEINVREIERNLISLIAEDSALLTAGSEDGDVNTMTVNWGGMGYVWHKNFCFIIVRKSRHTISFIRDQKSFSLNFFSKEYAKELAYCGKVSGRDEDKFAHCGFTKNFKEGIPYIEQASLVIECRTMYTDDIEECNFVNKEVFDKWYKGGVHEGDMHEFFIGEIVSAFEP